jgi:predicted MPP superfamily phosphohydrolase
MAPVQHSKRIRLGIALLALLAVTFAAGGLVYRSGVYRLLLRSSRVIRQPHFYPAPQQDSAAIFQKETAYPFTFIVYGDSREPAGHEKDALIAQIIRERPSFVIHLGDMVLYDEPHQWRIFDNFEGQIMQSGIPFYPVLGNHEYYVREGGYSPDPRAQLAHYFSRFSYLEGKRWYSFIYGNCTFLVLDTNTEYQRGSYQYAWLQKQLQTTKATFLFVAFHHPPYTKAPAKRHRTAERYLADIFERHEQTGWQRAAIVFSADAHNYERYRSNGVNYVVSAGGGAPQHDVMRDAGDFYTKSGRTFHYCKITVYQTELVFEMLMLDGDSDAWVVGDTFTIGT